MLAGVGGVGLTGDWFCASLGFAMIGGGSEVYGMSSTLISMNDVSSLSIDKSLTSVASENSDIISICTWSWKVTDLVARGVMLRGDLLTSLESVVVGSSYHGRLELCGVTRLLHDGFNCKLAILMASSPSAPNDVLASLAGSDSSSMTESSGSDSSSD